MRAWILPCLALLFAAPANATITLVQHNSVTVSSTASPVSLAVTSPLGNGNALFVSCGEFDNGGGNIPVIHDGLGSHFLAVTNIGDGATFRHGVYVYANTLPGASTIICSSTSATFFTIMYGEYSGVDTRYPVDTQAVNQAYSASGNSKAAGAITTLQANEVLIAAYYDDHIPAGVNFTATIGSGFTIREQSNTFGTNTQGGYADLIVSSIQTGLNPAWSDGTWAADGVTLIIFGLREAFSTAPGIIIDQTASNSASNTFVAKAYTSSTGAGHLSYAICYGAHAGAFTLTITDTNGAYTVIDTLGGTSETAVSAYQKNIPGGANTVTCTSSQSGTGLNLAIIELQGLSATAPLDQHSAATCLIGNCGTGLLLAQAPAITTTSFPQLVLFTEAVQTAANANDDIGPANFLTFMDTGFDAVTGRTIYGASEYEGTATGTFRPYSFSISQTTYFLFLASFIQGPPAPSHRNHGFVL